MNLPDPGVVAAATGVPLKTAAAAVENLASGAAVALGVNGWQGSGKDSLAPQALARLGYQDPEHVYFAKALKDEVDHVITAVRMAPSLDAVDTVADVISEAMNVPARQAAYVIGLLWVPAHEDSGLTSRHRTPEVRAALQYWGTQVRRRQDRDYWVRKATRPTIEALADGRSVMITDVRFPNEADGLLAVGATVVRIEISRHAQGERLFKRDGIIPDHAALYHESEVALDDFPRFHARVDNNGAEQVTVRTMADIVSGRVHDLVGLAA
jgi:hypothetical protein